MKNPYKNTFNTVVTHHENSNDRYQDFFCYSDFIRRLEREASEKVFKKNAHQDSIVKNFEPTTVLYLLDSNCAYGSGHSALLFLNKRNEGIYYNTAQIFDLVEAVKGGYISCVIDRRCLNKDYVKYLLTDGIISQKKSPENIYSYMKYNKFIAIPLHSLKEGKLALQKAEHIYRKPGLYNLYERNCSHITQEILAEISNDFSPTIGSAKLVINRFTQLKDEITKMDFNAAKSTFDKTYSEMYETGMLPNGAYEKGIKTAKERSYKYGKLPIKNVDDFNYKKTKALDPLSDNFQYISDMVKKHNENIEINKQIRSQYSSNDPYFQVLKEIHKYLERENIKKVYNIINRNGKIKLDKIALKKLEYLYEMKYPNLEELEQKVMENFIKSQRVKNKENVRGR